MNADIKNMGDMRAYKFRIYPDAKRQEEIDKRMVLAQQLYNKMLEKVKTEYTKDKNSKINKSTLNRYMKDAVSENKEFLKLYSQTRQDVFIRLQKAYSNFFRRCREKREGKKVKVGFPRFKSIERYKSITYPQDNGAFSIEKERKTNMLRVSCIGRMKIELHRPIDGKTKTMTIKKEGKEYYAIFAAEQIISLPKIEDTNPVGIDMGVNNFVVLSNGKMIQKPKFFKKREKRIAKLQRILARRTKWEVQQISKLQSKRRNKAKLHLQKEWNGVTNQSNDFMQNLSTKLVNTGYTSFAVEKLQIQNMVKNHNRAQSIQNASWNRFINMLSYKAESAGMEVIRVNPQYTSMTCSNCGGIKKIGEERTYICDKCGLRMDRDINASINILNRAREGHSRSHAQGDIRQYVPTGDASSVEELRTYPETFRESFIKASGEASDF